MKSNFTKILCVLISLALIVSFAGCGNKKYEKTGETTTENVQSNSVDTTEEVLPANINPLTGLEMSETAAGKRPVAIMVENSPEARPQWGLSTPDIVIEGLVEGGITRMMWIYADVSQVPKVGPVRSARHDYVEIAYGMNAVYVHWGASNQARDLISKLGYADLEGQTLGTNGNESNKGYYFFKDPTHSKATEHCGYTTGEYIAAAIEKKGIDTTQTKSDWAPFKVVTGNDRQITTNTEMFDVKSGTCTSVTVTFSSSYKHTFKYNSETKLYYNFMNTSEMKDGNTGTQMAVKNVIVMYLPVNGYQTTNENDKKLREWDLTGGDALYITNGCGERITWKKGDASSPLKFYGQDGKELIVNKGQTWIGAVPVENSSLTQITG